MNRFALIICTYMRRQALARLLDSINNQYLYPNRILIVDGSLNDDTRIYCENRSIKNLDYFKVGEEDRGLTKQRNFGIQQLPDDIEIVCFLDDDIVLAPSYFQELINTYQQKPDAIAVGGYITNEVNWIPSDQVKDNHHFYCYDNWCRKEPQKFKIRKKLGLLPEVSPGKISAFSHGRSISFLPPSGKTYQVEQFMGGVSSYKKEVFKFVSFSSYFEGYGLYEDVDFCIRIGALGNIYVNTKAQLNHYHEPSGRPNQFKYGIMVVRNGWYVWRLKNVNPNFKERFKWNMITGLQIVLRFINVLNTKKRKEAITDGLGRFVAWLSLIINSPKIIR